MADNDSTKKELKERIKRLEEHVYPDRRDILKAGAGAAVGGAAVFGATGNAAAGSQSTGEIGTQSNPVDGYVEDLYDHNGNQPLSLPGNGSVEIRNLGHDIDSGTDVTASRSLDTSYSNSNEYVMAVYAEVGNNTGTSANIIAAIEAWPSDGTAGGNNRWDFVKAQSAPDGDAYGLGPALVPPGGSYRVKSFGSESLNRWTERGYI